jgi:phosphatidate cytidylyltransferase
MNYGGLKPSVLWALGGVFAVLILASLARLALGPFLKKDLKDELRRRVRTWWVLAGIFAVTLAFNRTIAIFLFAFLSFLALKEYLSLVPTRQADRRILFLAFLTIPLQYLWIWMQWYGMFLVFIPVYIFLLLAAQMALIGETKDYLRAAGVLHWGLMITVFSLSHAGYLLALPAAGNPKGGGAGLLLFLVFLTEFNDVGQYLWGKSLGRHFVVPRVSPKKTWEGMVGGVLTTVVLAALIAPWLTPFDLKESILAGLIIGLSGFLGDITMSAVKRDLGVKDSGRLLPGHGGILDRVDSLTFAAPLFFHFTVYLHYPWPWS